MTTVPETSPTVNPTSFVHHYSALPPRSVENVMEWLDKGNTFTPASTSSIKSTMRRLKEYLEHSQLEWNHIVLSDVRAFYDQAGKIANLFLGQNPSLKSPASYKNRPKQLIREYLRWQSSPSEYHPPIPRKRSQAPATVLVEEEEEDPPSPEEGMYADQRQGDDPDDFPVTRHVPLDDGEEFLYRVPNGITIRDVERIRFNLMTLASDFDPANMSYSSEG